MLKTLTEAKEYAVNQVTKLSDDIIDTTEKSLIEDLLEEHFFEKVSDLVDEQTLEEKKLISEEELEGYLFHEIPNYTSVLEEATAEWLSEYLSQE